MKDKKIVITLKMENGEPLTEDYNELKSVLKKYFNALPSP